MIIDVYRILFEENFTPSIFFFLIGIIVAETYLLVRLNRHNRLSNAVVVGITVVSVIFSMSLVARPNEVVEEYDEWYSPEYNGNGCMIEAFKNMDPSGEFFLNTVTFQHYFEGKEVLISDDISSKDEIALYLSVFSSADNISFSDEYSSIISCEQMSLVEEQTRYIKKDSRKYILDRTWKNAEKIIATDVEGSVYFVSEDLFTDILNNNYEKDLLSSKEMDLSGVEYMNSQRGEHSINQIILLLVFFIIGFIPCTILFKGRMRALSIFLSFPVGISIATIVGVIFIIFGIPYRRISLLIACVLVFALEMFFALKKREDFDLLVAAKSLCAAAVLDIIVVELKLFKFCTDSAHKMWCAYVLAEGKASKGDLLAMCLPWGMLEPIVHAIGWRFKSDIVYGIYLGTFICSIGIIVSAAYYLAKKENKTAVVILSIICAAIYASNNDAFIIGIWAHGNGPTGCMILSMLITVYVSLEKKLPTKWLATMLGFTVIVTRVEGGIYVSLLLLLLCGISNSKENGEKFIRFNIIVSIEIMLWQVLNIVITTGHIAEENEEYWTPEKAILLLIVSGMTIILTAFMNSEHKVVKIVRANYYKFAMGVGILAVVAMYIINTDVAYDTAKVFIRHFATSRMSNSGVLWSFTFAILPLLLTCKKKKARFLIAFVADYVMLQFLLYCVRDQADPIHILIGDSCRRTLQQILSTSMAIIPLIWNELYDGKRKFLEEK